MTEEEWLASSKVGAMLRRLRNSRRGPKVSTRKLQFFAQAVSALVPQLLEFPAAVEALRLGDEAAEKGEPPAITPPKREYLLGQIDSGWGSLLCWCLLSISDPKRWELRMPEDHAETLTTYVRQQLGTEADLLQVDLLRDVVGNPFRPVAFPPDWRTSTAVAIARGMYESRDFSAMPILADALQDAGCDNDDVLQHCRDEAQVHVRGCWVVDLVLGKS